MLKALLAPVFKHQLNRGRQAFETLLAGFALAIGFRHLGAEGDEPLAIALNDGGVTISHGGRLFTGRGTDKLKTCRRRDNTGPGLTPDVLECGGNPANAGATPLSNGYASLEKRRRRGALTAHPKTWRALLTACLLSAGLGWSALAQFAIPWHTIGGGTSTGGVFSVSGTLGQSDAGEPMSGGNFSLTGGFWTLPQVVQTEGAPTLTVTPASPGFATLSWTPATPGFVLQETVSLAPANWTNSPSGAANPVTVPATLPAKFYRLYKP